MDGSRQEAFAEETRALALRRARVAIGLGSAILVIFVWVDAYRVTPEQYAHALGLRLAGLAVLGLAFAATRGRHAVRVAEWVGSVVLTVLILTTAAMIPLFTGPGDPQYAVQVMGIVLCVLGAGLVLPLGPAKMLGLGSFALAAHLAFTWSYPFIQNLPMLAATFCSAAIATAGARELTRSRRSDFEAREAKGELLRTRSDFVAMLTHDIKNPLAAIEGYIEMLQSDLDMPRAHRAELLSSVQRVVRTAIHLAVDFLAVSKMDADRFVLTTAATDVGALLHRAVNDHRASAAQRGIILEHESAIGLPPVDGDVRALDRVFANLIGNALKHTSAGGTVRLTTHALSADRIEVVVEDTGEGIAPGHEKAIFERYTTAASRADSTGLGLFIARTIVVAHGGSIAAENREECRGARFRVVLPVGGG